MDLMGAPGPALRWAGALAVTLAGTVCGPAAAEERVIGGPCEGCENVYVGMPENPGSRTRIAPPGEPGEPMVIEGTVRTPDGEPAEGVIVYAYHTDVNGVYPRGSTRHGRLRGWARTDGNGTYRFDTIRPAAYPERTAPQHVHMHVIEPGRVTYYIDDLVFDDDPLLDSRRRQYVRGRGGDGIGHPEKDSEGVWHVRRDIVLGANVPGYPCPRRWTSPVPFYQSVSWSPDGSRIAVSAVAGNWAEGYRIFTLNADGTGVRKLETGGDSDLYPVWSPDGTRIAFASRRGGNSDIYVMGADGSDPVRLTRNPASDGYPSWSPDGERLAFHSNRDGDHEIYVMNADGSDVRQVTDHPADDYNPAWSPDGGRIAFDSDRDEVEGDEIYVISPDGTGLSRVVDEGVFPTWSPDGTRILYASGGLFTARADGSEPERVLEHAMYGAWSPDGERIAAATLDYDEQCRDHHSLIAIGGNGPERTRLLP